MTAGTENKVSVVPSQTTEDRLAGLSAFQLRVLRLMATGLSNTAIATQLGISRRAVENHVSRLLHALGLVQDDAIAVRVCAVLIYLKHSDGLKHGDPVRTLDTGMVIDGSQLDTVGLSRRRPRPA
jgi:DNA-binding NarL/FixJ family response regulator